MNLRPSIISLTIHFSRLSTQWRQNLGHAALAEPGNTSQQAEELLTTRDSFCNGVDEVPSYITPLRPARPVLLSHIWVITRCELHSLITKPTVEPLRIPAPPTSFPPVIHKNKQEPKSQTLFLRTLGNIVSLAYLGGSSVLTYHSANYRKKADCCVFDGKFCPISSPPAC